MGKPCSKESPNTFKERKQIHYSYKGTFDENVICKEVYIVMIANGEKHRRKRKETELFHRHMGTKAGNPIMQLGSMSIKEWSSFSSFQLRE